MSLLYAPTVIQFHARDISMTGRRAKLQLPFPQRKRQNPTKLFSHARRAAADVRIITILSVHAHLVVNIGIRASFP